MTIQGRHFVRGLTDPSGTVGFQEVVSVRALTRPFGFALLVALLCGLCVGGVSATWVFPTVASAATNCPANTHHLNDVETSGTHYGVGVKGTYGMWVFNDAPVDCDHISSILMADAQNNNVETGWIDGVVGQDLSDFSNGCKDSGTGNVSQGTGAPEAFRAKNVANVSWTCTVFPNVSLPRQQYNNWAIKNPSGSNHYTWNFLLDGSTQPLGGTGLTTSFDSAKSLTNGERWGADEPENASFRGVQYLDGSNAWHDWGGATCLYHDSNDTYNTNIYTEWTFIQVTTTGNYCQ